MAETTSSSGAETQKTKHNSFFRSAHDDTIPLMRVTVSNRTILKVILLIVLSVLAWEAIVRVEHMLTLIFVSFFLALALNPAVSWIATHLRSKSRVLATGIAYLLVVAILATFLALVLPPLVRQTTKFVSDLPHTVQNLQTQQSSFAKFVRRNHLQGVLQNISQDISAQAPNLRNQAWNTATKIGDTVASILTVFVLTFMMLVEGPRWLGKFWSLYNVKGRDHHKDLARRMYHAVTGYVNGQVFVALIASGFAFVTLFIVSSIYHVSLNIIALAGIVLIGGLIPMIGNAIAASIVILMALFSSVPMALTMLIYFIVYWQIENYTLQPYIQSRQNELSPLLVFVSALIGIGFGGLLGALVSIPIASCVKILITDYLNRRKTVEAIEA